MDSRRRDSAPWPAVVVLAALIVSCTHDGVPRPRFPQIEQATEGIQGGGERFRDHRTCTQSSTTTDDLIRCMDADHWDFVAHGTVFPEPQCWDARQRGQLDGLAPHCFIRAPQHP